MKRIKSNLESASFIVDLFLFAIFVVSIVIIPAAVVPTAFAVGAQPLANSGRLPATASALNRPSRCRVSVPISSAGTGFGCVRFIQPTHLIPRNRKISKKYLFRLLAYCCVLTYLSSSHRDLGAGPTAPAASDGRRSSSLVRSGPELLSMPPPRLSPARLDPWPAFLVLSFRLRDRELDTNELAAVRNQTRHRRPVLLLLRLRTIAAANELDAVQLVNDFKPANHLAKNYILAI
ncbi:hypothetical protein AYI69_g4366 [Smittium culicis]|uniref:Uncharacterized protein n=1 Tax=Smittium culicis TaxID=133412 RepID=A0A1R1YE85_9FUNG|nr:hypothetical protein AYI69_g4366 [Smittium culicis]